MPEYAPGTPSWVELSSPDADAAAQFYGELMGWSATEPGRRRPAGTACSSCRTRTSRA